MPKAPSPFILGLALFSMFFGSGNLIFPLYIGKISQGDFLSATFAFLLTAVTFPFLGILAMSVFKGDYISFFNLFGTTIGGIFTTLLLTVWIPFGSAPRCIALAYASTSTYFDLPDFYLCSLGICIISTFIVYNKNRMLDFLGYFLTPLLLICLAIVVFKGIISEGIPVHGSNEKGLLLKAVREGYQTMDLIAAFFFSASIFEYLNKAQAKNPFLFTLKSCLIGLCLLATVYFFLIALAASFSSHLHGVPKDQLLAHIGKIVLGPEWGLIALLSIVLACWTTLLALISTYADFLSRYFFHSFSYKKEISLGTTVTIIFIISNFGLEGISRITSPVLEFAYPLLITTILLNFATNTHVVRKILAKN